MISKKQKQKVIELFLQGTTQTTIVKKENISRTKVAEIIKQFKSNRADLDNKESKQEDVESDPEIIELRKELRKVELKKKIREEELPFEIEEKFKEFEKRIIRLEEDPNSHDNWGRINKIEKELGID